MIQKNIEAVLDVDGPNKKWMGFGGLLVLGAIVAVVCEQWVPWMLGVMGLGLLAMQSCVPAERRALFRHRVAMLTLLSVAWFYLSEHNKNVAFAWLVAVGIYAYWFRARIMPTVWNRSTPTDRATQ